MVKVAIPPAATTPVPSSVEPSMKFTEPVGVEPVPVTVAVRVMAVPTVAALMVERLVDRVVVVDAVCTVCTRTGVTLG